jgi:hypothetical protein
LIIFVAYCHKYRNAKGKIHLSKKKEYPHTGTWLEVDRENKKVKYKVDSFWMKNANAEEQKIEFAKLTTLADTYRRAGYAIVDIVKKLKK